MRMRHMTLADYGISQEDGEKLYKYCMHLDDDGMKALHKAALESCGDAVLADIVIQSLTDGKSYGVLSAEVYIPVGKDDFYAYRRKTIATLYSEMS